MRILAFILLISISGCKSLEKQRQAANKFFDSHPAELATKCDKIFPVSDSSGEITYGEVKPGGNIDYRSTIDSLVAIGDNAMIQLLYAKKRADTISEQCADVVLGYMRDLERIQQETKRLHRLYRPCSPDTLTELRIVYRRSMAREALLKDSLDQITYQLSVLTDQSNDQVKELSSQINVISHLKADKNGWMWKAIGTWIGVALLLGAGLFYLLKK